MVVLAAAAFVILVGLIISFRIMRNGIGSLEKSTARMQERIAGEERKLADEMRHMTSEEHMAVTRAAVADLLRLTPGREHCAVEQEGNRIVLHLPEGEVSMMLAVQEMTLRSSHKALAGQSVWQVRGGDRDADFRDIASAMRHLDGILRGTTTKKRKLPQFSRRFAPQALPLRRTACPPPLSPGADEADSLGGVGLPPVDPQMPTPEVPAYLLEDKTAP